MKRPIIINLMLGSACNWNCAYCLQTKQKGFGKKIDPDWFCDNLLQYLKRNNITEIQRVNYWGGEPLLYKDTIYRVNECLSKIKHTNRDRIITNGSLVDWDFVQFANEYQILTNLSYHQGQLEDDQWEKMLHIRYLYVTSIISHQTLIWDTFFEKWQYIYDTFGRCVNWFVYPIHATKGVPEQYWLTEQDVDQYFEYLDWVLTKADNNTFYNRMVQVLFYNCRTRDYDTQSVSKCYSDHTLSIDLQGNRYLCHHDCERSNCVGNIFTDSIDNVDYTSLYSMGEACTKCELFDSCLGGCFRDETPSITCMYYKRLYAWLLKVKQKYPELVNYRYYEMVK